jgi:predicted Zn-dependent protease
MQKFLAQQGLQTDTAPPGYPANTALFQAQTQQGAIRGVTTFFTHGGTTLQLLGYTPAERFTAYDDAFRATFTSFAELTDPAALAVQPARIELVKLSAPMTVKDFHARYPSTIPLEEVALINGVEAGDTLPAGTVKRVTGGVKPTK